MVVRHAPRPPYLLRVYACTGNLTTSNLTATALQKYLHFQLTSVVVFMDDGMRHTINYLYKY